MPQITSRSKPVSLSVTLAHCFDLLWRIAASIALIGLALMISS